MSKTSYEFTNNYNFLVPLLLPWLQEICVASATNSMTALYDFDDDNVIPTELIANPTITLDIIRDKIVPQLYEFMNSIPNITKYLKKRFRFYFELKIENPKQNINSNNGNNNNNNNINNNNKKVLSRRQFELFMSSIVSDMISYVYTKQQKIAKSQGNNNIKLTGEYNFLLQLLPIEISMIIQYIRSLIYVYEERVLLKKGNLNEYNIKLCCSLLIKILNHDFSNQLVIDKYERSISDFNMLAETILQNAKELLDSKKIIELYEKAANNSTRDIKTKNEIIGVSGLLSDEKDIFDDTRYNDIIGEGQHGHELDNTLSSELIMSQSIMTNEESISLTLNQNNSANNSDQPLIYKKRHNISSKSSNNTTINKNDIKECPSNGQKCSQSSCFCST